MKRYDIIRMAREVFDVETDSRGRETFSGDNYGVERFAALVTAAEREACAAICDTTPPYPFRPSIEAAHAIRARGQV